MIQNNSSDDDETDSDYEDSEYYEEMVYDCEENSATKYNIVLCELYNDKLHGKTNNDVSNHYLLINRIKKLDMDFINNLTTTFNLEYIEKQQKITPHKFIRNYQNMITSTNYIKPEIGEVIYLSSGHTVCIIKTMWLRVIQRAWKKVYNQRKQMFKMRCRIHSLKHREITGHWPQNCRYMPSLQGILTRS